MILIDCGVFMRTAWQIRSLFDKEKDEEVKMNMVRHIILKNIIDWQVQYKGKYGDIVLCDDIRGGSWRKDVFPYYKANRRKTATEEDIVFFNAIHHVKEEISKVFKHWTYMQVEKAEADDIIASLSRYFSNNKQRTLIISHDHDMIQLQAYQNVDVYSAVTKKILKTTMDDFKEEVITHIVKGDSGDGVPNIFSDDDTFVTEGKKQKSVTKKVLAEFLLKGKDATDDPVVRERWDRNIELVMLTKQPEWLYDRVIEQYKERAQDKDKSGILQYITDNRLLMIYDEINNI